jgi:nucleoside-diphosphate-sugar epimerase
MELDRIGCTGGSGDLGKCLVDSLLDKCLLKVIDLYEPHRAVDFDKVDITDYNRLKEALRGCEAVVHLAAISNPRISSPESTFRVNVQGTWATLQAAEDAGVRRVVVASSDATTGLLYNPKDWSPQYLPVDERHPLRPTEAYSLSKVVTETICQSYYHRGKLEIVVLRPSHIVFPRDYGDLRTRGDDIRNYHLWTYVFPEDVVQSVWLALTKPELRFDTFFISANDGLNTRPTLEMIKERYGFIPQVRKPEIFAQTSTASIISTEHAQEVLHYAPTSDWRRVLACKA